MEKYFSSGDCDKLWQQKEISRLSKKTKLEILMYRVNKDLLKCVHRAQMYKNASGIDIVNKPNLEENLDTNLEDLVKRMKSYYLS